MLQRYGPNVVASARLASEDGVLVLRTMDRECYCVAWSYLESFYGRAGFRLITAEALPPHLRARLGEGLIGLRREAQR